MRQVLNFLKPTRRWWPLPLFILVAAEAVWLIGGPSLWTLAVLTVSSLAIIGSLIVSVAEKPHRRRPLA